MSEYLILKAGDAGWVEVQRVQARDAAPALRAYLQDAADEAGTYAVVPARRWHVFEAAVETERRVVVK